MKMTKEMLKLKEQYVKAMQIEVENPDEELAHPMADTLLCELLIALGFDDVVDKFNQVGKWYA